MKGITSQQWMAVGTVAAFSLAGVGALYASWVLLPALWAHPHSKGRGPLSGLFVAAFAVKALGSRLRRKGRQ